MQPHDRSRTVTHAKLTPRECREIAREEKIFICFFARDFQGHHTSGDWKVIEPFRPVSPGQEVTWQAVGQCEELKLDLPETIFENLVENRNMATATVKDDAPPGLHLYEAYVNGQLAIGGSSPGVIVDPGPHT